MKQHIYIILAVLLMGSTACEKVIDIDLKNVEKKYVIEAVVTDEAGAAKVLISQTKNFSDDNDFNGIENALVTIKDNDGNSTTLQELSAGVYTDATLAGIPGETYTLSVKVGDETFTSSTTMPAKINMDSLYITEDYLFGEIRKSANVDYIDPIGKGQSFRFIIYQNGVKSKSIYIQDDEYSDGKDQVVRLRSPGEEEEEMKTGDIIKVEMLAIDPSVFKYWNSFLSGGASGSSSTASPANPTSNISGGALGYFSVHNVQSKTVTVP